MLLAESCNTALDRLTIKLFAAIATLALLLLSPGTAQGQTAAECYDPLNAQTVGQAGWTGCEGMYIVKDRAELLTGVSNGFKFTVGATDYTFADGPNRIFTGQVTDMSSVFAGLADFNSEIGYWDTSNVTDISEMFSGAKAFNQDISGWDTSSVTDMSSTFVSAWAFNRDISTWDTSSVTTMLGMFDGAAAFNFDISAWNTSSVSNMDYMFDRAAAFNQDLSGWNVGLIAGEPVFFDFEATSWTNDPAWRPQWGTTGTAVAKVRSVLAVSSDGIYGVGDQITIDVAFSQNIYLIALSSNYALNLLLETGDTDSQAAFDDNSVAGDLSGPGAPSLRFIYTVAEGDQTSDLDYGSTASLLPSQLQIVTKSGPVTFEEADLTLRAPGSIGSLGASSNIVIDGILPTVTIAGPSGIVAANFTASLTFSEPVTGLAEGDITVTGGTIVAASLAGSGDSYTVEIAPDLGSLVQVSLPADMAEDEAGNGNTASNTFVVQAGSPASEFEAKKEDIKRIIREDARRMLESAVAFNQKHVRSARDRLRASQELAAGETTRSANVPFDITGGIVADGLTLSTSGSFYGQEGSADGATRRIAFGDFDLRRDEDGSTTATFRANVAWERMLSDRTLLGYYLGAELGQSQIDASFTGKRKGYGLNAGAYIVSDIGKSMIADGFLAFGLGRHQIDLTDGILTVEGDYDTRSTIAGASLSGLIEFQGFTLSPELSAVWGRMDIGEVAFTGHAYGITDSTLALDAGQVTLANLALSSEIRIPLIPGSDTTLLTLSPKVFCQRVDTDEDCNAGGSVGFSHNAADGLTRVNAMLGAERFSGNTQTSLSLDIEHRF